VDRIDRMIRINIGLSKGVLIHFQFQVMLFSNRRALRAMRVTMWIMHMAQPWTEPLAKGVKTSKADIA
jgi:hypothetical protein